MQPTAAGCGEAAVAAEKAVAALATAATPTEYCGQPSLEGQPAPAALEQLKLTAACLTPASIAAAAMPPPPPKPCGVAMQVPPPSCSLATSSQRDALTAPPSRLLSADDGSDDKDEYLMRLLRKGTPMAAPPLPPAPAPAPAPPPARPPLPPPLQQFQQLPPPQPQPQQGAPPLGLQQTVTQEGGAAFRAPGPVRRPAAAPSVPAPPSASPVSSSPSRRLPRQASTSLASPSSLAGGATVPSLAAASLLTAVPSAGTPATTTDQAVPASHHGSGGGSTSGAVGTAAATAVLPAPAAAATSPTPAAVAGAAAAPGSATPPTAVGEEPDPSSFAATRRRLGDEVAYTVRNTMIRQQVMFLEQLYDLHRAIAIQKLLMQNCPEVQQVMGEAMRLMSSVGSQHGSGSGRGSRRQRTTPNGGGATVPGSGSDDPSSFRPDSQFAAVPQLPGEAQTAGASGDEDDGGSGDANGSGSGQNGSGGGSTSPQPGGVGGGAAYLGPPLAPPYMYLAHTVVPTPSGASAAPNAAWGWGMHAAAALGQQQVQQQVPAARGLPPVPQGPPQMPPWVGQDAGLAAVGINTHPPPSHTATNGAAGGSGSKGVGGAAAAAAAAGPPAEQPAAAQQAPKQQQVPMQRAAAMVPPPMPPPMPYCPPAPGVMMGMPGGISAGTPCSGSNDPLSWWYQNYYGTTAAAATFQQQQAAQQQMGGMTLATAQAAAAAAAALMPPPPAAGTAAACATAGQARTTAAAGTGVATTTKWWQDPQLTFGPAVDPDVIARRAAAATIALANREGHEVQSAPAGGGDQPEVSRPADPRQRRGGMFVSEAAPPRMPRALKRKAAADADEASSGTTGHEHDAGPSGVAPGGPFKRQESMRGRSARAARGGAAAAAAAAAAAGFGGGAQDENAAELLLAIRKQ